MSEQIYYLIVIFLTSGLVPLHNACSYGHYEVTEMLLKVRMDRYVEEWIHCDSRSLAWCVSECS